MVLMLFEHINFAPQRLDNNYFFYFGLAFGLVFGLVFVSSLLKLTKKTLEKKDFKIL